jgi:tRNA(Ile)-lysidine synthase
VAEPGLPPREFVSAVREYCAEHELVSRGDTVLVGVSGGPDSVALLLALYELSGPLRLKIRAAHLDHGLRKNSRGDLRFVLALARELGIPAVTGRASVGALARRHRISVEEAGRLARYGFFRQAAKKLGAQKVAVGHNRDDQAETVLMRLLRGSSGSGLSGISPKRPLVDGSGKTGPGKPAWVIRPLLERSRAEIESFLRLRGQGARKDPTNADTSFMRNRIRHELLPLLEKGFNPRVRAVLARAAQALAEDDAYLEDASASMFNRMAVRRGRAVSLGVARLSRIPLPLRRRVLLSAAVAGGAEQKRLTQPHLDALIRLVSAGTGSTHLPGAVAEVVGRFVRFAKR